MNNLLVEGLSYKMVFNVKYLSSTSGHRLFPITLQTRALVLEIAMTYLMVQSGTFEIQSLIDPRLCWR